MIGLDGVKALAEVLTINQVRLYLSRSVDHSEMDYLFKTLVQLKLDMHYIYE